MISSWQLLPTTTILSSHPLLIGERKPAFQILTCICIMLLGARQYAGRHQALTRVISPHWMQEAQAVDWRTASAGHGSRASPVYPVSSVSDADCSTLAMHFTFAEHGVPNSSYACRSCWHVVQRFIYCLTNPRKKRLLIKV